MKKIKKTIIPRSITGLLAASQHAKGGLVQYGAAIHVAHNTEAALQTDVDALVTARDAYENGKTTLKGRHATVLSVAKTGRDFLMVSRDALKPRLGRQYSSAWTVAGFVRSLSVSQAPAKIQVALQTMQTYLAANPEAQAESLDVTAARAEGLFNSLNAAHIARNVQKTALGELKATRDAAFDQLVTRLLGLQDELLLLLSPMDQRWLAFGFKKPGAQVTPEVPQGVSAVLIGPTAAAVKWTAAHRAEHYRIWKKVVGTDAELLPVGSSADLDFTLEGLPSHASVQIALSAVNEGGESALSSVITLTTN